MGNSNDWQLPLIEACKTLTRKLFSVLLNSFPSISHMCQQWTTLLPYSSSILCQCDNINLIFIENFANRHSVETEYLGLLLLMNFSSHFVSPWILGVYITYDSLKKFCYYFQLNFYLQCSTALKYFHISIISLISPIDLTKAHIYLSYSIKWISTCLTC